MLQLTGAGDIFYQMLKNIDPTNSEPHQLDSVEPALNIDSALQLHVSLEEVSDFERERHQRMLSQVVGSDRDNEDGSHISDENQMRVPTENGINSESGFAKSHFVKSTCAHPLRPASPKMASHELKLIWKIWLESLLTKTVGRKCHWKHRKIKTSVIMKRKVQRKDRLVKDGFWRLRKDQAEILKTRKLLLHGVTYLPPLEVNPVPDGVDPDDWPDDLSQRISVSWRDGWRDWWIEKLGLDRDSKIKALRRKRNQSKRSRARNRASLSLSFTSSLSYQGDFSEWSSATSQHLHSDEENNSQSAPEDDLKILSKSTVLQGANQNTQACSDLTEPIKTILMTPEKPKEQDKAIDASESSPVEFKKLLGRTSTVESNTGLVSSSLTSLKESHSDHQKQDNKVTPSAGLMIPRSQPSSFLSPLRASLRTLSQGSQPQKKKSRMGF